MFRVQAVRLEADGGPGTVHQDPDPLPNVAPIPEVAMDSQDRGTVVWGGNDGLHSRVVSMRLDADSNPEPPQYLSPSGDNATSPQLSIDSQGRATVVWSVHEEISGPSYYRIQSVRLDSDGNPEPLEWLTAPGQNAFAPEVAVDSQDSATVVWQRSDGSSIRIQSVRLGADGMPKESWTSPPRVGTPPSRRSRSTPRIGRRLSGSATNGANDRIQFCTPRHRSTPRVRRADRDGADGRPSSSTSEVQEDQVAQAPQEVHEARQSAPLVAPRSD